MEKNQTYSINNVIDDQKTYLITDGNFIKIGRSKDPERRLKELKTANPKVKLICYGQGAEEKYLHTIFHEKRYKREWFDLSEKQIEKAKRLILDGKNGYVDELVYELAIGKKKSNKKSEKYIIDFGKYKGTPIDEMLSEEQQNYCYWLYGEMRKNLSRSQKKRSRKYKAFSWAVRVNSKKKGSD